MRELVGFIMNKNYFLNFYPAYQLRQERDNYSFEKIPFLFDEYPQYGIIPLDEPYTREAGIPLREPLLLRFDESLLVDNENLKARDNYQKKLKYDTSGKCEIVPISDLHTSGRIQKQYLPILDVCNLRMLKAKDGEENYIYDENIGTVFEEYENYEDYEEYYLSQPFILADFETGIGVKCSFRKKLSKKGKLLTDRPVLVIQKLITPKSTFRAFQLENARIVPLPYSTDPEKTRGLDTCVNDEQVYLYGDYYEYYPEEESLPEEYRILEEDEGFRIAKKNEAPPPPSAEGTISGEQILQQISDYLASAGRPTERNDIVNYCVCLTQGFITTFSGAPGTGKTTLCRLLAEALGLTDAASPRYAEVSVGRGWSDIKDFVGYVAPFDMGAADEYDGVTPTNIEICKAFFEMHKNIKSEEEKGLYLMTLDEANLSPIEYYWSQFLRLCQLDDDAARRTIQVGKLPWQISPNLRFLATVNFDHTTEALSPRFLDRSWVIPLSAPEETNLRRIGERPALPTRTVTIQEMQQAFGAPEGDLPEEIAEIWTKIRELFAKEDIDLPLSPRNILAVENYCIAASRYINAAEALDYAVLQKILPTISGYGERFTDLVSDLRVIAEKSHLVRVEKYLSKMVKAAKENSNFYQFFVR